MNQLLKLTLFCMVAAIPFTMAPLVHAQQPGAASGVVEGVVVNRTTDAAAAASVQLQVFNKMDQVGERKAEADAQGRFRFDSLDTGPDIRYVLSANYGGVDYAAPEAVNPNTPQGPITLSVYDTTTSDADISIVTASIAIPDIDRTTGLIQALEVVTFTNKGNRTYVGSLLSDPARGGVLKLDFPQDALDISLGDGFGPANPTATEGGLLTRQPVPPGPVVLVYAYKLPFATQDYTLARTFAYPTEKVNFLIAAGGPRPASSLLTDVRTVNIAGTPNLALSGQGIGAGQPIVVNLSGLPPLVAPGSAQGGPQLDTALRWAAIGLMAVGLAASGLYVMLSRRRLRRATASAVAADLRGLESERRELVASLAAMDERFQAGGMPRADYDPARRRLKQRLLDIMLIIRETPGPGVR